MSPHSVLFHVNSNGRMCKQKYTLMQYMKLMFDSPHIVQRPALMPYMCFDSQIPFFLFSTGTLLKTKCGDLGLVRTFNKKNKMIYYSQIFRPPSPLYSNVSCKNTKEYPCKKYIF